MKRARREGVHGKTGTVTFVQRFGGAIHLNVHTHSLFPDGVYFNTQGKLKFFRAMDPADDEIAVLVKRIRDRVVRNLTKKGYAISDFSEDPFAFEQPAMAELAGEPSGVTLHLGPLGTGHLSDCDPYFLGPDGE